MDIESFTDVLSYNPAQVWVPGILASSRKWPWAADARFGQISGVVALGLLRAVPAARVSKRALGALIVTYETG